MPFAVKSKKEIPRLIEISRRAGKAIVDYRMIEAGDRIAVAVSGGKDSLSLLHILRHRRQISPVDFTFTAVHVDFGWANFDSKVLIDYFKKHDFEYCIEKMDTFKNEKWEDIDCFWYSRNRRRGLFEVAAAQGFNKIAFGHHMDDIVETILLNQFYRGEIGAMKPKQELFDGKMTIIRPLAYEREAKMVKLAEELGIASMGQSKCANDDTSKRQVIKKMLRDLEQQNPQIIKNIFKSLQNIRTDYLL